MRFSVEALRLSSGAPFLIQSRGVLLTAPAYGSCKFGVWLVPILFSKLPLPPAEMLIRTRVKPDKNKAGWVLWCVTARCNFSVIKNHDDRMSYSGTYMQGELITRAQVKLTESRQTKSQATRYWSSYTTLAAISKFLVPGPKSLCSCPKDIHFNMGGGKCLSHATWQPHLCLKKPLCILEKQITCIFWLIIIIFIITWRRGI